jgi:hypothetical protein
MRRQVCAARPALEQRGSKTMRKILSQSGVGQSRRRRRQYRIVFNRIGYFSEG